MKNMFTRDLQDLILIANKFDAEACLRKTVLLNSLKKIALPENKNLPEYYDTLLFLCAYPNNTGILNLAEKELKRITLHAKLLAQAKKTLPENEGLPFTNTITRFTPDFLNWLLEQKDIAVKFDSFYHPSLSLNEVLNITLPSLLKPETTAGLNNEDLLQVLKVKPGQYLTFLVKQMERIKDWPLLKDLLMERLDVYIKLVPKNAKFSRAYNRLTVNQLFYHQNLLKKFDHEQLINDILPSEQLMNKQGKQHVIRVIKNSMALTARETDPTTYMQEDSIRFYKLERGIDVAIYSMIPQRQLPLESYVGFTLFKNGFPVSYGGAWIFGRRARIGINIFESFRGGESGYILCQLLRVYKQVFKVSFFEAEPYQYGLDNPDGITTAAFWFYYRYGFRPIDRHLLKLAESEQQKINTRKKYHSTAKTLLRFTESNIALNFGKHIHLQVSDISRKAGKLIRLNYQNNTLLAEQHARELFCNQTKLNAANLNDDEKNVLTEVALWSHALNITKSTRLQLMLKMIYTKPKNVYAYQQLLLDFFESE